ncbi:MAG: hypothetical protein IPK79_07840 [Vampirovibrionales bacterium]|nr:hypothetical protein [Vampirovibrionales bacterium]
MKRVQSTPSPVSTERLITQAGLASAFCYGLLSLPTVALLAICVHSGVDPSRLIENAWRPWRLWTGVSGGIAEEVLMDGALFAIIGASAVIYFWLARRVMRQESALTLGSGDASRLFKHAIAWNAGLGVLLLVTVPFDSSDLYGYINRGAQQAFYGLNPYVAPLAHTPGWAADPMFHAHWVENPSPYGPLFTRFVQGICLISGRRFWLAFLLMKLSALTLHLFNCWMLWKLAQRWGLARPWLPSLLYGWHPLMLLQMIANGHNDLWVSAGLLAALWLLTTQRYAAGALPAIMVSALTKYASLMALPLTALMDIRHKRWRSLMIGALTCVLALIVLAGPYLQDMAIVGWPKMAQNAVMAQHSIHSALGRVVFYAGRWVPALRGWDDTTRQALRIVTLLAFVGLYGWALRRFWRELACLPSAVLSSQRLAYWIMLLLTAFLALASAKFHAWYLGMIFPLYLITPVQNGLWDWPRRFGLMLAAFQLLSFTSLNNIHILNFLLLTATPLILSYRAARAEQKASPANDSLALQ